jgi:hypothetical protein
MKKNTPGAALPGGKRFMGERGKNTVKALFDGIVQNEKNALKLLGETAKLYYEAGNIIAAAVRRWKTSDGRQGNKAVAEASGFPEERVTTALKIYKGFENNPAALDGLTLRGALKLIAPPPPSGGEGCSRIDLGGDPGQLNLGLEELFGLPSTVNKALKNYRMSADLLTDLIVAHKGIKRLLTSRRFMHFCEDVPQIPALRAAYKEMAWKTQAAIEGYLAVLEREEGGHDVLQIKQRRLQKAVGRGAGHAGFYKQRGRGTGQNAGMPRRNKPPAFPPEPGSV